MSPWPRRIGTIALIGVCLASCFVVNPYVRGDGNGYFAWLASTVVDGDLDFRNQYRHADPLFSSAYLDDAGGVRPDKTTPTGHVSNQWSVGPAILWAPWFLAAHAVVRGLGIDPEDGFARWYRLFCAVGTLVYAGLTLAMGVQLAGRYGASQRAGVVSAWVVLFGSSLFVYAYMLPFHVHALAAFTVALFFRHWHTTSTFDTVKSWCVWGALAGLMAMTYHVDALFGLAVVPVAIDRWRRGDRGRLVAGVAAFCGAGVCVCAPQWIGKSIIYGHAFTTGYQDQFFWQSPRLWSTAFSSEHGLLLWTPLAGVGLAGCVVLARRAERMRWLLAGAGMFYVVIASYQNWHGLSSFGNRFFVSLTVPFIVGIAAVLQRAWDRGGATAVALSASLALLVLWNLGLAFQWGTKMIPSRGPVDPMRVLRQQLDVPFRIDAALRRYLGNHEQFVADIERKDVGESRGYLNRR